MKRKTFLFFIGSLLTLVLSACSPDASSNNEHVHEAGEPKVENMHEATCLEKGSYDSVTFCTTCGEEMSREHKIIEALGHDLVEHKGLPSTCEEEGYTDYLECTRCGYSTIQYLSSTGHSFGAPTYEWSDDYSQCTAKMVCNNDSSHVVEETVLSDTEEDISPTIISSGSLKYTATFTNPDFVSQTISLTIEPIISDDDVLEFVLNDDNQSYSVRARTSIENLISIPRTYNNLPVTKICQNAFAIFDEPINVAFTDSIITIGENAFSEQSSVSLFFNGSVESWVSINGLENIKECGISFFNEEGIVDNVVIPSSVVEIPAYAFSCLKADMLSISSGVTTIGDYAFYLSSLKTITMEDDVEYIGKHAFEDLFDLESLTLSKGLKTIDDSAFDGCYSLQELVVPDSVVKIGSFALAGLSDLKSLVIGENVEYIGDYAFNATGYNNHDELEVIFRSEKIHHMGSEGVPITSERTEYQGAIYAAANNNPYFFLVEAASYHVGTIAIHPNCKIICEFAFAYCQNNYNLIDIPNSVIFIGNYAFSFGDHYGASDIHLGEGLLGIGEHAFFNCYTEGNLLSIPKNVKEIASNAFSFGTGYSVSEDNEYYSSYQNSLYNKDRTTLLRFYNKADNFVVPEGVTRVERYAFSYVSNNFDKIVTLPETVLYLAEQAFYWCRYGGVNLPNSLLSIGDYCFEYFDKLETINIGDNLSFIGAAPFLGLRNLKTITVSNNNEYFSSQSNVLFNKDKTKLIYGASKDGYSYTVPTSAIEICEFAFDGADLDTVILPEGLTTICEKAFNNSSITYIKIPNTVTHLGSDAFTFCDDLALIIFPENDCETLSPSVYQTSRSESSLKKVVIPVITDINRLGLWFATFSHTPIFYRGSSLGYSIEEIIDERYINYETIKASLTIYYYSEEEPVGEGNYWHYDNNGLPVIWE